MTKPNPRSSFHYFDVIATRWSDNDMYGHVNNVVYYAYFDTVVNRLLMKQNWLDPMNDQVIAVVAETQCRFISSVAFPDVLEIGLRIERLGTSSVTYHLGVFIQNKPFIAAEGRFVHVYVNKQTRQPVPIPAHVRQGLLDLSLVAEKCVDS